VRARAAAAFAAALAAAVLAGCTDGRADDTPSRSDAASRQESTPDATVHEVDLGDDRVLYMTCAGTGIPTVVLESGYHESSDSWMITSDPADTPVFERLSQRHRVCAYDRPGTLLLMQETPNVGDRTTPVSMPRTAGDVATDLHEALAASGEAGPYLLVAHSLGGVFTRLYAQLFPEEVAGVVFVDAFPIEIPELFGSRWAAYSSVLDAAGALDDPAYERIDIEASVALVRSSGPFPDVPVGVISKVEPFAGLPPDPAGFTAADLERAWLAGQPYLVELAPGTPHVLATGSDHYVHVHQPDLVEAMVDIVAGRADR
jgi:pimeloyl-ACP methyl ester carboxylesterase